MQGEGVQGAGADVQDLYRRAREAMARGNHRLARELLARIWAVPAWRADRELQRLYALACEQSGDYTEALRVYRRMIEDRRAAGALEEAALAEEAMLRFRELAADVERDTEARRVDLLGEDEEGEWLAALFEHGYDRRLKPGEVLCRGGDVARAMWLLVRGEVDVSVPGAPVETLRGRPDRPCLLGELGYFTNMRRMATLVCATAVHLRELPYERLAALERSDPRLARMLDRLYRKRLLLPVLARHEIFRRIHEPDLRRLAAMFERVRVGAGDLVVPEDREHPHAYFVQGGVLLVLRRGEGGRERLVGAAHPGDMVHLGGLLRGFRPRYQVLAGSPARLLRLPRERFETLMVKRPWLVKAILEHARMREEEQVLHPEARNLWAVDRYVPLRRR